MNELKNNQVEIALRYTGSDPGKAMHLARTALTFKGFKFENLDKPVEYQENNGEYTATLIATNQFLPEQLDQPPEKKRFL